MCTYSMVMDSFTRIPEQQWDQQGLDQARRVLEGARVLDEILKQPDCEDPAKGEFLKRIEMRLDRKKAAALIAELVELAGDYAGHEDEVRRDNEERAEVRTALKLQLADLVLKHRDALLKEEG